MDVHPAHCDHCHLCNHLWTCGFQDASASAGGFLCGLAGSGHVPWFFYSEVLNTVTNCLQEYSYLVKKVVFKVEILPIIKLMSCLMVHGFFVLIMLGLYL